MPNQSKLGSAYFLISAEQRYKNSFTVEVKLQILWVLNTNKCYSKIAERCSVKFLRKHTHLPTWSGDLTLVGSGGVLTTGSYFSGSNLGSGVDFLTAASFTASTGSLDTSLGPSLGIISFSLSFLMSASSPVEMHHLKRVFWNTRCLQFWGKSKQVL